MTVANLIHEFLAPVQPDDCKHASLLRLATALKASGPVVFHGKAVSAKDVGDEVQVDFEAWPFTRVSAERDPTDAELAAEWKLPLAAETPLKEPSQPATT